jgi:hypothetical protein
VNRQEKTRDIEQYCPVHESYVDFGQQGSTTYIDGATEENRYAYHARHYGNLKERERIDNFIISPATLSMVLLWGYHRDINDNLQYLNKELAKKK